MSDNKNNKKLTLAPLILMIFTSVFGFANMPRAFLLMGYSAIPWYIFSALFFFIPYAFMMAEYGSTFQRESGGMYSWMEWSIGPKYAFIGTFMWYASYLIWMVSVSTSIWLPLSNALFGMDLTSKWSLFGLNSVQTLGILAVLWIITVTFIGSKGLDSISKITSIGGSAIMALNIVLLVGGIIVFALNGKLAQPINNLVTDFTVSPNIEYESLTGIFSFLTFALFAYGGLEVLGGLVDQTENAEYTFPKGLSIAAIIISIGYALGIFACGMFTNWNNILNVDGVHLANVVYILIRNLGYQLGLAFGFSETASVTMGLWFSRFVGLSMFLALSGAFFTLTYSPLKTLISGSPKDIWPGRFSEMKNGMPIRGMWVQAVIVIVIILIVSFGGDSASEFFKLITLMTNVAMTIPYMFLSIAFPFFKKKQLSGQFSSPFLVYKSYGIALTLSIIVTIIIGFANVFTIIQPVLLSSEKITETITMIAGPLIFSLVAYVLYTSYERKNK